MRSVIFLVTIICKLWIFSTSCRCQETVEVKFQLTGYDLKGNLLTQAEKNPGEFFVKAVILEGGFGSLRDISVSQMKGTLTLAVLKVNGNPVNDRIVESENSIANFSVDVPAKAEKVDRSIVLVLGRKNDNGVITAVVPFMAIPKANVENTINVAIPKHEPSPCPPLECTSCRPAVRVRPSAASCLRVFRRQ